MFFYVKQSAGLSLRFESQQCPSETTTPRGPGHAFSGGELSRISSRLQLAATAAMRADVKTDLFRLKFLQSSVIFPSFIALKIFQISLILSDMSPKLLSDSRLASF
jgi:hypothetical protein